MLEDWNLLLDFLAEAEELQENQTYDLLILAGNSLPLVTQEAAKLYQKGIVNKILVTGGIGHATHYLRENYAKLGVAFAENQSEAEMNQLYLHQQFNVPLADILVEGASTNSGENALFSLKECQKAGVPKQVILMQDPILQRRIKAAFQKAWEKESTSFTNYVPCVPQLVSFANNQPAFKDSRQNNGWATSYFIDLVLGEIPRLMNNETGYGPKGSNFIVAVDVPEDVQVASQRLKEQYHGKR